MTSALSLSTMAYAKLDEEIYAFLLTWPPPNLAPFYPCTPTSHTQTYSPAPPWLQHWPCPRWLLCQTGWWNLCLPVKMTPQPCPLPFSPLPPHTNTYSLAPPWLQPWPCPPWLYVKLGEEIYAFLLKWHPNPALSPFSPLPPYTNTYSPAPPWLQRWPYPPWLGCHAGWGNLCLPVNMNNIRGKDDQSKLMYEAYHEISQFITGSRGLNSGNVGTRFLRDHLRKFSCKYYTG